MEFSFIPRRRINDVIFSLRLLMEMYQDMQVEIHMVFIDLEKTYDWVATQEIWSCLSKKGLPEKYVILVMEIYEDMETKMKVSVSITGSFSSSSGSTRDQS